MAKNILYSNLKGTKDFLPAEQVVREKIVAIMKEVFSLYGFLPVETPILNSLELLSSKYAGGAEILKEVYSLRDQGERDLGLRYDLTVPFSKLVAGNPELVLPFRRFEIGRVFRNGPVKLGRMREFYQCDVDVCGIAGNDIEVEMMNMTVELFNRLDIDVVIEWNNRKLMSGLILEAGIEQNKVAATILVVDKLEKYGKNTVSKELQDMGINAASVEKLLEFFNLPTNELFAKFENTSNELLAEGLSQVSSINNLISQYELQNNTKFVPSLARGLDIYTGTVWEVFERNRAMNCSLAGAGRYDAIITNFVDNGNIYPAVGIGFGLEPIYEIYKSKLSDEATSLVDVYIYSFSKNKYVLDCAKFLRSQGLSVIVEMQNIKLKKALPWAEKNGINNVLIIGETEEQENVVTYKNLKTSTQETLTLQELVNKI